MRLSSQLLPVIAQSSIFADKIDRLKVQNAMHVEVLFCLPMSHLLPWKQNYIFWAQIRSVQGVFGVALR